jgi:hypothetical protein
MRSRSNPLYFWQFGNSGGDQAENYLDPELQVGTTPLVKLMGGIATRNFKNLKHPSISVADYMGPRAIIDGRLKLVVRESKSGETEQELFDLIKDPAETKNLIGKKPVAAKKLQAELRTWQESVLNSLTGADYQSI